MYELSAREIEEVSGGTWYNIGHAVGSAYAAAVDATTDFFVWVDELDGSLAD